MDEWYYALNQTNQGPVSLAALLQLLQSGQLPADNLVWRDGMPDWVPANTETSLSQAMNPVGNPYAPAPVLGYGLGDSVYAGNIAPAQFAGFWIRFAGAFIDSLAVGAFNTFVGFIEGFVIGATMGSSQGAQSIASAVSTLTGLIIGWLYIAFMLSSSKQATLGMMAVRLRVTDLQGNKISFARATGRHFASILSLLILCIGYLMMLWSTKRQTLHDLIAGTIVLKN